MTIIYFIQSNCFIIFIDKNLVRNCDFDLTLFYYTFIVMVNNFFFWIYNNFLFSSYFYQKKDEGNVLNNQLFTA